MDMSLPSSEVLIAPECVSMFRAARLSALSNLRRLPPQPCKITQVNEALAADGRPLVRPPSGQLRAAPRTPRSLVVSIENGITPVGATMLARPTCALARRERFHACLALHVGLLAGLEPVAHRTHAKAVSWVVSRLSQCGCMGQPAFL